MSRIDQKQQEEQIPIDIRFHIESKGDTKEITWNTSRNYRLKESITCVISFKQSHYRSGKGLLYCQL